MNTFLIYTTDFYKKKKKKNYRSYKLNRKVHMHDGHLAVLGLKREQENKDKVLRKSRGVSTRTSLGSH